VLWLFSGKASTNDRLRAEAAARDDGDDDMPALEA